ncbi:FlgO family outer membrane protein [Arcobacter sp. FWKO B]|uniref:FlgO family outer membrane protein n=1 Tax=Arcobacter sp. FWKO B TaxID=2593672 RepID=UPI0018A63110|nr:FlgO family outer membrane protein [Arcobacter sp. FWKO B]QOG12482.1 hypothetical protein FWKOB_07100 [Arcobacter sp. FWKO B]
MKLYLFLPLMAILTFGGCLSQFDFNFKSKNLADNSQQLSKESPIKSHTNIKDLSENLATQLFNTHLNIDTETILVTSFVDINQLNTTNNFGRLVAENMINDLHTKGFRVKEYRGQSAISINSDGEFHITRDIEKLSKEIQASYILVGTYATMDNNKISVNARIIDFSNGDIYATATSIYSPIIKNNTVKATQPKTFVDIVRD